jgi:hypothetical protein
MQRQALSSSSSEVLSVGAWKRRHLDLRFTMVYWQVVKVLEG